MGRFDDIINDQVVAAFKEADAPNCPSVFIWRSNIRPMIFIHGRIRAGRTIAPIPKLLTLILHEQRLDPGNCLIMERGGIRYYTITGRVEAVTGCDCSSCTDDAKRQVPRFRWRVAGESILYWPLEPFDLLVLGIEPTL